MITVIRGEIRVIKKYSVLKFSGAQLKTSSIDCLNFSGLETHILKSSGFKYYNGFIYSESYLHSQLQIIIVIAWFKIRAILIDITVSICISTHFKNGYQLNTQSENSYEKNIHFIKLLLFYRWARQQLF